MFCRHFAGTVPPSCPSLGGFTVFNFDRRAEAVLPLLRLGVTKDD